MDSIVIQAARARLKVLCFTVRRYFIINSVSFAPKLHFPSDGHNSKSSLTRPTVK